MRMDQGPYPLPLHPNGNRITWEEATEEQRAMITALWDHIASPKTSEKDTKAEERSEKKARNRRF